MNFRVFIRTFFLVAVISTIAFVVYANKVVTEKPVKTQVGSSQTLAQRDPGKTETGTADSNSGTSGEGGNQDLSDNSGERTDDTENNSSRSYVKEDVTIKISALGDVALGQDMRFLHGDSFNYVFEKEKGNYNYFFSNVVLGIFCGR